MPEGMMMPESGPERIREQDPLSSVDPFEDSFLTAIERLERRLVKTPQKSGLGYAGPIKPPPPVVYGGGGESEGESKSLAEFMTKRTREFDRESWASSPLVKHISENRGSETDFANVFWSLLISTGGLIPASFIVERPPSRSALRRSNFYIVPHESNRVLRHNLLVFVPENLPKSITIPLRLDVKALPVSAVIEQMIFWEALRLERHSEAFERDFRFYGMLQALRQLGNEQTDAIQSLINLVVPSIVFVKTPPMILHASLPAKALGAAVQSGQRATSSAGVIAKDGNGNEGITVAFHGLTIGKIKGYCGQRIEVDGLPGEVVSVDALTDSAFVKLDGGTGSIGKRNFRSVRSRSTPGYNEPANFNGLASGPMPTLTDATAPLTVVNMPGYQRTVVTKPDTEEGDSGCALIDQHNDVMGFCLGMTGISEVPPVSIWVWAESVFNEHNLT